MTRKSFWGDEIGLKITFEEWQAYVRSDPQVCRDKNNGPNDFLIYISGGSFPIWYNPELGELYSKDVSDEAILKLKRVARALGAKVQGDDGEDASPEL